METAMKAVKEVRDLGGDMTEQLAAFRLARRERRLMEAEIDLVFLGWEVLGTK